MCHVNCQCFSISILQPLKSVYCILYLYCTVWLMQDCEDLWRGNTKTKVHLPGSKIPSSSRTNEAEHTWARGLHQPASYSYYVNIGGSRQGKGNLILCMYVCMYVLWSSCLHPLCTSLLCCTYACSLGKLRSFKFPIRTAEEGDQDWDWTTTWPPQHNGRIRIRRRSRIRKDERSREEELSCQSTQRRNSRGSRRRRFWLFNYVSVPN